MDSHSKRPRNKPPKQLRKGRPVPLRPIISGEIISQFPHSSSTLTTRSSGSPVTDRLNDIIDDITSEGDDARGGPASKPLSKSSSKLVEPDSPIMNENHSSPFTLPSANDFYPDRTPSSSARPGRPRKTPLRDKKQMQYADKNSPSPSRTSNFDDRTDSTSRRKSIGDIRRHKLTECMEYYRHCLESAQHSYTMGMNDDPTNSDKRRQYTTTLW